MSVWSTGFYGGMKPYSSKLRTLACRRQRLNRLSIRLYVPRVITRFQEAKTLVVLPFIVPPREKTMGWKGRLLRGRCRTLWSATESRYLLTSRDGLLSCSGRLVERASLLARETTVRSYSALASPVA